MWVFREAGDSNPYPAAYLTPEPLTTSHNYNAEPHIIICARREEGVTGPQREAGGGGSMDGWGLRDKQVQSHSH